MLFRSLVVEPDFIARFRQEARTAALFDHPNLVPVYDFSETEGRYYIAMGYMPGGSLKDLLKREGKLEPERACEVLAQLGEGLKYAHARGIIHRDLKPGNILFDESGRARVADMGFAKVMSEGASRSMSASGGLVGTPAYMAPETWRNKPATPQTDIYSLGCILYEMLTGRVLFEGESPADIMTMHVIDGPQYAEDLPQELRPVLDKALQRDPTQRFVDTQALLAAFRSVLEPTRKEPAADSENEEVEAVGENETQTAAIGDESALSGEESGDSRLAGQTKSETKSSEIVQRVEKQPKSPDETEDQRNVPGKSILTLALIGVSVLLFLISIYFWVSGPRGGTDLPDNTVTTQASITDTNTSLVQQSATAAKPTTPIPAAIPTQKSMTGASVITAANAGQVEQLARFGKGLIGEIAYSPDGSLIALASSIGVYLYDSQSLEEVAYFGEDVYCRSLAWSPDGTTLASGSYDNTIILWAADSGAKLRTLEGHTNDVNSVAWSSDGTTLASGSDDGTIILWKADSGAKLRTLEGHTGWVESVAWSPDGTTLASGDWNGTIILWDADSGEKLRTLEGHTGDVSSVAWSPDGTTLASGSADGRIILWDSEVGTQRRIFRPNTGWVIALAWSPDGKTLVSACEGGTYMLWNTESGERLRKREGYSDWPSFAAWSPDGKLLAWDGDDGIVLWSVDSGTQVRTLEGHTSAQSVAWSLDGNVLASGTGVMVILWDVNSGSTLRTLEGHSAFLIDSIALSPDGKTLASAGRDGTVRLWGIP